MSETFLGDIPGNRFYMANVVTHASVASNGANARLDGFVGPFLQTVRIISAWWQPDANQNTAATTDSYRRLSLYNGGTAGTATATASRLASLNLTASVNSRSANSFTVVSTGHTIASNSILYFSHETVGGAETNATVLAAGHFSLVYELL